MNVSHVAENLAQVRHETEAFARTLAGLDDQAMQGPSFCEGWTRAHVIAHVSRNAEGLARLATWAATGVPAPMYLSEESRDADIVEGATWDAFRLRDDFARSADVFAVAADRLTGPAGHVEVEARGGRRIRGIDLITLRLRELVFHHVDLEAGHTFADADPGLVARALDDAVRRLGEHDTPPSLRLRSTDGSERVVGAGETLVSGPAAGLLLWLSRGRTDQVDADTPLPHLPAWG